MSCQIDLGQWNSIFAVPSAVVDRHLKLATESQLKVLLYLLRHSGEELPDEAIAKAVGISGDEVKNALAFWTERGLLRTGDNSMLPAESPSPAVKTEQNPDMTEKDDSKKHTAVSRAVRPDTASASRRIGEDAALAGLMEEAQSVLRKPLSPGDTATLVMLYDTFGLPCEVIAMLLNYTASIGSPNMRAVERIGISWSDNGVYTVEGAEREIERMVNSREAWGRVSAIIGLHNAGNPTAAQLNSAERWLTTWGFSDEMILEAYERCVNAKGTFNMSYMNAILKKWYEKKVFSIDALKAAEARPASPKRPAGSGRKGSVFSSEGASFDMDAYESKSLFDD